MLQDIIADGVLHGGDGKAAIQRALGAARRHLGVEVAYVSEFVGDQSVFRHVDAPGLEALIKPGDERSLDDVYCRHILAGRLPELMPDTADYPLTATLPITRAVPIGAHVSVPLRLPDGSTYGMFCCLSPTPNRTLNGRDLELMRVLADVTAHQIAADIAAERDIAAARAMIDRVIEEGAFTFQYQPIFGLKPFRLLGFEALCRFTAAPYRSPDHWFNDAARAGRGVALELAAIEKAVAALAVLPDEIFVSINASPETVSSGRLPAALRDMPMERLILEVTEHAPVADYAALFACLAPLRAAGARLAIDDAGAGYAGLQHILQLKPDVIKLDMGLTRSVDTDQARRALASALAYFAAETHCSIVAEGIETATELATLRELGVAKGQGYLLGRPLTLSDAIALAREGAAAHALA